MSAAEPVLMGPVLAAVRARVESAARLLASGEVAWARVEQLELRAWAVETELARQVNERMKDRALASLLLASVQTLLATEAISNPCRCWACTHRRSVVRGLVARATAAGLDVDRTARS